MPGNQKPARRARRAPLHQFTWILLCLLALVLLLDKSQAVRARRSIVGPPRVLRQKTLHHQDPRGPGPVLHTVSDVGARSTPPFVEGEKELEYEGLASVERAWTSIQKRISRLEDAFRTRLTTSMTFPSRSDDKPAGQERQKIWKGFPFCYQSRGNLFHGTPFRHTIAVQDDTPRGDNGGGDVGGKGGDNLRPHNKELVGWPLPKDWKADLDISSGVPISLPPGHGLGEKRFINTPLPFVDSNQGKAKRRHTKAANSGNDGGAGGKGDLAGAGDGDAVASHDDSGGPETAPAGPPAAAAQGPGSKPGAGGGAKDQGDGSSPKHHGTHDDDDSESDENLWPTNFERVVKKNQRA